MAVSKPVLSADTITLLTELLDRQSIKADAPNLVEVAQAIATARAELEAAKGPDAHPA